MRCPYCQHKDTQVIDSRAPDEGAVIRRRRRCLSCGKRFTTFERAQLLMPLIVKRGGIRTEYNRQKMLSSMMLALRKRSVSFERVEDAADFIEQQMILMGEREIRSNLLGDLVLDALSRLDIIAYIRFASVYLNISDPESFIVLIQKTMETSDTTVDLHAKPTTERTVEALRRAVEAVR